ncbi:MAG TPA: WGxxGxxG family protein [Sphingomicrobium sp.]|nr:WGxxGxxG family protein [Sphingomicrobium sp.]
MRFAIAAIVAAGLVIAPAVAQETNEANVATATNAVENVGDNVAAVPPVPTTAPPATTAPAVEPAAAPARDRDRGGSFPWGILGLIGLVGLLGRIRT